MAVSRAAPRPHGAGVVDGDGVVASDGDADDANGGEDGPRRASSSAAVEGGVEAGERDARGGGGIVRGMGMVWAVAVDARGVAQEAVVVRAPRVERARGVDVKAHVRGDGEACVGVVGAAMDGAPGGGAEGHGGGVVAGGGVREERQGRANRRLGGVLGEAERAKRPLDSGEIDGAQRAFSGGEHHRETKRGAVAHRERRRGVGRGIHRPRRETGAPPARWRTRTGRASTLVKHRTSKFQVAAAVRPARGFASEARDGKIFIWPRSHEKWPWKVPPFFQLARSAAIARHFPARLERPREPTHLRP